MYRKTTKGSVSMKVFAASSLGHGQLKGRIVARFESLQLGLHRPDLLLLGHLPARGGDGGPVGHKQLPLPVGGERARRVRGVRRPGAHPLAVDGLSVEVLDGLCGALRQLVGDEREPPGRPRAALRVHRVHKVELLHLAEGLRQLEDLELGGRGAKVA